MRETPTNRSVTGGTSFHRKRSSRDEDATNDDDNDGDANDSSGGGGSSDMTSLLNKSHSSDRDMKTSLNTRTAAVTITAAWWRSCHTLNSTKLMVLVVLSLQNSLFTVLRRYSQGVLREDYSKYEVLLVGEIIKMLFSAYMIHLGLQESAGSPLASAATAVADGSAASAAAAAGGGGDDNEQAAYSAKKNRRLPDRIGYLVSKSGKMVGLALIYGAMNILSFVSLRNIGAGMFTIFAQCKILTTAAFSTVVLSRKYSWTKWRALLSLMFGVLLFSEPIWGRSDNLLSKNKDANVFVGVSAVLIEVTLSGFASIYFEKVIKTDPLQLTIWERNFQLALGSFPVYLAFIAFSGGGTAGVFGGWSMVAFVVAMLGAAGGLLVALSIKYGDAILKTLATTAAIILSSVLDRFFMGGPLTPIMMIAGVQVIVSICNYTFDSTPASETMMAAVVSDGANKPLTKDSDRPIRDSEVGLVERKSNEKSAATN